MLFGVVLLALNCFAMIGGSNHNHRRQRRYLVYPDGGPARAQFIIGLGIPVDLKEQSVTVGTVIKFQYDLPTNSTEYTSRIYGFVNTVSRDMDGDVNEKYEENALNNEEIRKLKKAEHDFNQTTTEILSEEDESTEDNALVDITFEQDRIKRSLVYAEGGVINTNDVDGKATELPLEEAIRRQEMIDKKFLEEQDDEPKRANRWDFYKIIEHMTERYGFSGRPCLLRTICEAAEVPFTHENGLLGEIGHILFTPSTTKDSLSHHTDNEYHAAERLGRAAEVDCQTLFPECETSVLDTFTQIGINTLHKFGMY